MLTPKATLFLKYLQQEPTPGYADYKALDSLLFLFPYYVQLAVSQATTTLEENIANDFGVATSNNVMEALRLSHTLLGIDLPPFTSTLLLPSFNLDKFNSYFGLAVTPDLLFSNTEYTFTRDGLVGLGQSMLFAQKDALTPRERLEQLFIALEYMNGAEEDIITLALANDKRGAIAIFCQYFRFDASTQQTLLDELETWQLTSST